MKFEYEKHIQKREAVAFIDASGVLWVKLNGGSYYYAADFYKYGKTLLHPTFGTHIGEDYLRVAVVAKALEVVPSDAERVFYKGDKITIEF